MNKKISKKEIISWCFAMCGAVLYAVSFNVLILPMGFYSGNLTGVAQIINDLIRWCVADNHVNFTGGILYAFNIPLFILAYRTIGKKFMVKSILIVTGMTALMQFIPVPAKPLIDDSLTTCIIAGIITGYGTGLTLRHGFSSGGTDILGLYFAKKLPDFSVGKIQNIISSLVFVYCLFRYDLQTVVYSAIFLFVTSAIIDKTHTQNIKTSAIIFTKDANVSEAILHDLKRGATCWKGEGCYNRTETYIFMTILSKYEIGKMKELVHDIDPNAFIILNDKIDVDGNFIKRL